MTEPSSADTRAHDIATAPGDLPLSETTARIVAQARQFRHDNTIVPLAPRPGEPVEVWATSGSDLPLERAAVFYTTDGQPPDSSATMLPMEVVTIDWDVLAGYLTRWRAILPAQSSGTVVRYCIGGWQPDTRRSPGADPDVWAHDGQGFWFRYPDITTFAYRVEPPAPVFPAWVQDAVIYHIFLDRFHPGTPDGAFTANDDPQQYHGGTLSGVYAALPYLVELGVNCLWLSPIGPSESYHRYDATDYHSVDPLLGTGEDLRALTAAAHALGMHVLLDFVPSHLSWHHPAFEAARRDQNAPTAGWFIFEQWPDHYRNFLQMAPFLVSLNTTDPGARAYIISSAVQWLRDYGIDGYRLDHAIGHGMDFWVAFRTATQAVAPDPVTVGEVTDTPDCLRRYRGRLDGVLDFPLARALRLTFATSDWSVRKLDNFLRVYERYMASGPGRVSFLDNHDMNRFLFIAGDDVERLKLAALCQFTLDATPAIYYGTEIGMSQRADIAATSFGGDAEARRDMPWDSLSWNHDLLAFYRALTRLRREQPALRQGTRRTVHLDERASTYAYVRSCAQGAEFSPEDVLTLLNLDTHEQRITLAETRTYTCLLTTGELPRISLGSITLAPRTGVALAIR